MELLQKAKDITNSAVVADRKLMEGFELWGEPLANQQQVNMMHNAANAVKNELVTIRPSSIHLLSSIISGCLMNK